MANKLQSVSVKPSTIASGDQVDVTVSYKANNDSSGAIVSTPGFVLSKDAFDVAASQDGTKSFKLKITRATAEVKSCRLEFQLFQDTKRKRVTVT